MIAVGGTPGPAAVEVSSSTQASAD
jgi:hypothetical protein